MANVCALACVSARCLEGVNFGRHFVRRQRCSWTGCAGRDKHADVVALSCARAVQLARTRVVRSLAEALADKSDDVDMVLQVRIAR